MSLSSVRPVLWTNEIKPTIDFYVSKLGFTFGEYNEEWGWASLHKDDCEIMLAKPTDTMPFEKPHFTGSLYISTNNVDALWEELKDKVSIGYPIESFQWGMREFAVYDNNGYMLQFGQDIGRVEE